MHIREIGCEDGKWMELGQDLHQCLSLFLMVLNFQILMLIVYLFTLCQQFQFFVRLITCHEGTDGEYRYSSTLSLTSALDEGVFHENVRNIN
jgi:hypothetical protein